jgi:hypothetical protein
MSDSSSSSRGVGFSSLLTVAFIVLKLTKVISWPWFWVLSPTIFYLVFISIVLVVAVILSTK